MNEGEGPRRALVVGSGGIAARHVANLRALAGAVEVAALRRPGGGTLDAGAPGLAHTFDHMDDALAWGPDVAVVANASPFHLTTAAPLVAAGVAVLVEKPLADGLDGAAEFEAAARSAGAPVLVGYCLRFHQPLATLRDVVVSGRIGRPLSLQAAVGQYLPDWRPGLDYRTSVTGQRSLGGGAILELSHEVDAALWIMGPARSVNAVAERVSDLDVDVEDTADILLGFDGGARGNIHLDLLDRAPTRWCRVRGSEGTAEWDAEQGTVRVREAGGDSFQALEAGSGERDDMYVEEMRHFLACWRGDEAPRVTVAEAVEVLRVCEAAKQSAAGGGAVVTL